MKNIGIILALVMAATALFLGVWLMVRVDRLEAVVAEHSELIEQIEGYWKEFEGYLKGLGEASCDMPPPPPPPSP